MNLLVSHFRVDFTSTLYMGQPVTLTMIFVSGAWWGGGGGAINNPIYSSSQRNNNFNLEGRSSGVLGSNHMKAASSTRLTVAEDLLHYKRGLCAPSAPKDP